MPRSSLPTVVLLSLLAGPVPADESINPLLKYACDKEADIAVVTNSLLKGEEVKNFRFSEELGTYNPWDMVQIDRTSSRPKIVSKSKLVKTCELSSGVYTITLEPKTFGKHLDGRCGASISSAITVTYDGIDILEKTAFEDYCHGNAPIIIRVTTFGATSEVRIKRIAKYRFY